MEHTKGELKVIPNYRSEKVLIRSGTRGNKAIAGITDDFYGKLELREANVARFVLCWNAHASLQAKADLHDELVDACEKAQFAYDCIISRTPTGPEREKLTGRNIKRMQALAKAKKLTGDMT